MREIPLRGIGKALFITRALCLFEAEFVLKVISGCRGQKDYFDNTCVCRAFEEFPDDCIANPLTLILRKHGGGAKKPDFSMTFESCAANNLAPAASGD